MLKSGCSNHLSLSKYSKQLITDIDRIVSNMTMTAEPNIKKKKKKDGFLLICQLFCLRAEKLSIFDFYECIMIGVKMNTFNDNSGEPEQDANSALTELDKGKLAYGT